MIRHVNKQGTCDAKEVLENNLQAVPDVIISRQGFLNSYFNSAQRCKEKYAVNEKPIQSLTGK